MGQCRTHNLIFNSLYFEGTRSRISKCLRFGKSNFNKSERKNKQKEEYVNHTNVIFNAMYFSSATILLLFLSTIMKTLKVSFDPIIYTLFHEK